jgi:nitronate monooxygenase
MPISTPLTARLGIRHPILSAPMDVIAGVRLTKAVSAAGGFGILGGGYGHHLEPGQAAGAAGHRT